MSDFWKTWLDIWCLADIAFGDIFAGVGFDGFEVGVKLILTFQNPISEQVIYDIESFSFAFMGSIFGDRQIAALTELRRLDARL